MSLDPLGDILKTRKNGQRNNMQVVQDIFGSFKDVANSILPEKLRDSYSISHLDGGILYIGVSHAAYAQELSAYRHLILRRLAMRDTKIHISDIRIQQKRI